MRNTNEPVEAVFEVSFATSAIDNSVGTSQGAPSLRSTSVNYIVHCESERMAANTATLTVITRPSLLTVEMLAVAFSVVTL